MKTKKLIPLSDYVLIEPQEKENKTKSGIILPDSAKEKPQKGKVIAIGRGKIIPLKEGELIKEVKFIPVQVKIGQIVLYKKWSGQDYKHENKYYVLIKEEDILAVEE